MPITLTSLLRSARLFILPVCILGFILVSAGLFSARSEKIMEEQLRARLESTAAVAAQQFDARMIATVEDSDDLHRSLVNRLRDIRDAVPGVRFAYLVRATDDTDIVIFIADADEGLGVAELDRDGDGAVGEDEEPAAPGDEYDIEGMEAFHEAFSHPAVDSEITTDQWGRLISGYAPIKNADGTTVAVLGLDMQADLFQETAESIFSPVALLLLAFGGALLAGYAYFILERRRFESIHQLDLERTALLDLATHQLGMPLATFRWWLEILRDRDNGQLCRETDACDQMQLGIDRMDGIIRSLQDAAHLQQGNIAYHPEPTDFAAFVDGIVTSSHQAFVLRKQRVDVHVEDDLPNVRIDRRLIGGVLSELLENARSYSPESSVIAIRIAKQRGNVRIEVSDRGCGIPEEDIPNLFHKFKRGSNAFVNKPVGNGLGLYIAKGIIERAGGQIWIRSHLGKGTTVSFTLPLA